MGKNSESFEKRLKRWFRIRNVAIYKEREMKKEREEQEKVTLAMSTTAFDFGRKKDNKIFRREPNGWWLYQRKLPKQSD